MQHQFIVLDPTSLSPSDAEHALIESLKAYGLKLTERLRSGAESFFLTDKAGRRTELAFATLVADLHLTGACELDRLRWADTDPHGTIEVQVPEGMPPIVIGTGPRTSEPLDGPGYLTNDVVGELLGDVLHYRRRFAEASDGREEFHPAFRAYRSYLAASVSSIDATLNRLSWFARNGGSVTPSHVKLLSRRALPLDEKLRKWLPIVTGGGVLPESDDVWHDYTAIKDARNAVVHVNDPDFMFSAKSAVDTLNRCRHGVGGLLREIARLLGRNAAPGVLRVLRAPLAHYQPSA